MNTPKVTRNRVDGAAGATRGFTLLEVLIALVVLSVGLLGLATLQMTTVQYNHNAYMRSQATLLAYDIADRMRANREAAIVGRAYDVGFAGTLPACGATGGGSVAQRDVAAWRSALVCALPLGDGRIERAGADDRFRITVQWDESRGEGATEVFVMETGI